MGISALISTSVIIRCSISISFTVTFLSKTNSWLPRSSSLFPFKIGYNWAWLIYVLSLAMFLYSLLDLVHQILTPLTHLRLILLSSSLICWHGSMGSILLTLCVGAMSSVRVPFVLLWLPSWRTLNNIHARIVPMYHVLMELSSMDSNDVHFSSLWPSLPHLKQICWSPSYWTSHTRSLSRNFESWCLMISTSTH